MEARDGLFDSDALADWLPPLWAMAFTHLESERGPPSPALLGKVAT